MKYYTLLILAFCFLIITDSYSQNIGIGTTTPTEKLEVNGNVKMNGAILNTGGTTNDFLIKNDENGQLGFKKGHGAVALNYIICLYGGFPAQSGSFASPFIGEVKLFAGNFAPAGWAFCHGQLLPINQYAAVFSILGTTYGGNGQSTFALPDLRGAAAVSAGTSVAGYQWEAGQKTN